MQSHALQKKTATRYAQCCCVRQTARVARIGTPTTVTAAPAPTSLSPSSPTSTPCRRRRVQRVMPPSRGLHELPLHHHRAPPGAAAAAAMAAIALLALTGSFRGTPVFSFRTKPLFCSFELSHTRNSYTTRIKKCTSMNPLTQHIMFSIYYCLFSARCTNRAAVLRLCRIRTGRGTSCS